MTIEEFNQLKEKIEMQYRDDMAAIERAWTLMNGTTAPDSLVDFKPGKSESTPLRSAEELGIPPASQIDQRTAPRAKHSRGGMTAEEKKERKKEYMRRYWAKRGKGGAPIAKKKFDALLLRKPAEVNGVHE